MGLFSKKPQPQSPTGFNDFLEGSRYSWITEYIDNRNEILEGAAFADMDIDGLEIAKWTMPKFKKLVAKLYAQYLDAEEEVSQDDLHLLNMIEKMPLNITIRRIKAKASGNNWSVQYLGRTVYYGKTLNEALKKLQDRNPKLAAKFAGPEA